MPAWRAPGAVVSLAAILLAMFLDRQLLDAIRSVLECHPEVRVALLFGSRARGVAGPEADLDLAIELFRGARLDRLDRGECANAPAAGRPVGA